nr:2,3-diaminopropionate biosynthesis protein SbnA [Paenibacillus daejeonensis]
MNRKEGMHMLERLQSWREAIGNTPLVELKHNKIQLFAKLESHNYTGSVKIRPAYTILEAAIARGEITEETTVIESSSGNFAIALASLCRRLGIRFIPVIDPNINPLYEKLLRSLSPRVEKVTVRDQTNGYLLSRLKRIEQLKAEIEGAFWTNQYDNPDSVRSHYEGVGKELAEALPRIDYVFIGTSSCGTLAGVSRRIKESHPAARIIAVDTEGSAIFGDTPRKRLIPGIGSSIVPPNLREAQIDDIILVPEAATVAGCNRLMREHALFVGGSSGTVYAALSRYFENWASGGAKPVVAFICADGGMAYMDTLYNPEWTAQLTSSGAPEAPWPSVREAAGGRRPGH